MKNNLVKQLTIIILSTIMVLFIQKNLFALPNGYSYKTLGTFKYGLFVPPSYDVQKEYPLVIYLHGYSDTVSWNLKWYNEPIVSSDPCIVLTPKCPTTYSDGWGNSWTSGYSYALGITLDIIDSLKKNYNIDNNRIYIYGVSMGGYGTYSAIYNDPDMFAAAYVVCGGGNTAIAPYISNIPLWIFHGSADPTVSVSYARDMYQAILDEGGNVVRYTEYPGVGHNSWDNVNNEITLPSWLLAQVKGAVHGAPDIIESLQGNLSGQLNVNLEWDSPSDTLNPDNKLWYYNIYRDDDLIASVDNVYNSYIDNTTSSNTTYVYKVSAVNYFFKESELSKAVSVTTLSTGIFANKSDNEGISVSPNPSFLQSTITIDLKNAETVNLSLYSVNGQLIRSVSFSNTIIGKNQLTIYTGDLPNGQYIVKLKSENLRSPVKLMVKH